MLTRRDKEYLVFLLLFSIFISVVETVGIGVIMPFINLASDFSLVESNDYLHELYVMSGLERPVDLIIAVGIVLAFFYLFRSGINLYYQNLLVRFSQGRYHLLAFRLFQNYLGMPYREFVSKNSSYLTKNIVNEANNLTTLLQAGLFMVSEVFVLLFIYGLLLWTNLKITLLLSAILLVKIYLLKITVSSRIRAEGVKRAEFQKNFYEIVGASFGNFKLIKLLSKDDDILKRFGEASYGYAKSNITHQTLQHVPRLLLEAIGFSMMVLVIVYILYRYGSDIRDFIPILSMYVLALYRLLPSINRILTSYNHIAYYHKALDIVHNELTYDTEALGDKAVSLKHSIALENVFFSFDEKNPVIDNVSLIIKKGQKCAFVGESGAGKSTLVDILIGLYKPAGGSVRIDSSELTEANIKAWREKVGYIPQSVYLFDGTVAENVAFGREYDEAKVVETLKQANIYGFLQKKKGLQTKVGEGGIQLSGGQKQRIAIARALYGEPEVLVLDEATSALDNNTETRIMEEIYQVSQNKTLIIIAHRLSTLKECDTVYELRDGKIKKREN